MALKQLRDTEQLEEFTAEADLLTALRHPQIVSFFGLYSSSNHEEFLVMELMPLGNLREFLIRERKVTPTELLLMYYYSFFSILIEGFHKLLRE